MYATLSVFPFSLRGGTTDVVVIVVGTLATDTGNPVRWKSSTTHLTLAYNYTNVYSIMQCVVWTLIDGEGGTGRRVRRIAERL